MIQITCTSCQALLSMDDAFAGAVCRCRHCGAIQTVPPRENQQARRRPGMRPAMVPAAGGAPAQEMPLAAGGSGLAGISDALSSGIPNSAMPVQTRQAPPPAAPPLRKKGLIILVLSLGVLLAAGAVLWLVQRHG